MMSGYHRPWKMNVTRETFAAQWDKAAAAVGCGATSDTLACMREVPWRDLADLAPKLTIMPIPDEKLVFADPLPRLEAGKFIRKVSRGSALW